MCVCARAHHGIFQKAALYLLDGDSIHLPVSFSFILRGASDTEQLIQSCLFWTKEQKVYIMTITLHYSYNCVKRIFIFDKLVSNFVLTLLFLTLDAEENGSESSVPRISEYAFYRLLISQLVSV